MQMYYVERIDSGVLSPAESHHCVRTMRTKAGDSIYATDGRGLLAELRVLDPNPRACRYKTVTAKRIPDTRHHIHIAIGPTKQTERIEWFVEKATEIGVHELTFIVSQHSERQNINMQRLEKKVISAAKQALRTHFPTINGLMPFDGLLNAIGDHERFIAHKEGDNQTTLRSTATIGKHYTVLVGPEGGFTQDEVGRALANGFSTVSLGTHRLRTETAGIVACQVLAGINE